jgi:hypothetical protein
VKRLTAEASAHAAPKKQRELKAIEALRAVYSDFPTGLVEQGEEPDFRVRSESGCVGIEVTEYFRPETVSGSPLQEQEALAHQVSQRATEECLRRQAPPLLASVSFNHNHRLSKKDVVPLADTIASLVIPAASSGFWSVEIDDDLLPESVDYITVYRPSGLKEPFISNTGAVWVPEIDSTELARVVAGKERKLLSYRRDCTQVWLLVFVDGFRISSITEYPQQVVELASQFDRVVVLHDWSRAYTLSVSAA